MTNHNTRRRHEGFTLMELILTMLVISVVLALAAPSMRGFFASRQVGDAATNMLALIQYARSEAVSRGTLCRLNIDATDGAYWLTVQEAGAFVEPKDELGRHHRLPEGASVLIRDQPAAQQEIPNRAAPAGLGRAEAAPAASYVQFYPDGRCDTAIIEIRGAAAECYSLSAPSACEPFVLTTPAEGGG